MPPAGADASDALSRLRQEMEIIQHYQFDNASSNHGPLSLGLPEPDGALGGGLAWGSLHEVSPAAPIHLGAAAGFALALAALAGKGARDRGGETLWVQTEIGRLEYGAPYGAGLDALGIPARRFLILRARRPVDALFAMEEALKCRAIASVIAELPDDAANLTATRRLSLAARTHDGLGLLLRHRSSAMPSAAMTRWDVSALSGPRDAHIGIHGGIDTTAFLLSLVKNRRGPCGSFRVAWSHHELAFIEAANPVGVAAPAADRPAHAAIA